MFDDNFNTTLPAHSTRMSPLCRAGGNDTGENFDLSFVGAPTNARRRVLKYFEFNPCARQNAVAVCPLAA